MKKKYLFLVTVVFSLLTCFNAFAGEWKQDNVGWWYANEDTTYAKDGWKWIDGRCYYFTPEGYCLLNTLTPDGYTVDGSGAWIVNGVVQTQGAQDAQAVNEYKIGSLTFTQPSGFTLYKQEDEYYMFVSSTENKAIGIFCENMGMDISSYGADLAQYMDLILDLAMEGSIGPYTARAQKQLTSGSWVRYDYASTTQLGIPGALKAYVRLDGANLLMVMFIEETVSLDTDSIMNSSLR